MNVNVGSRCTGHCCRHFHLPVDPVTLRGWAANAAERDPLYAAEVAMIADMVIWEDSIPVETLNGVHPYRRKDRYTCKHFTADGNCSAYESRPKMCSDYPYGRPCEHGDACTWNQARAGLYPPKPPLEGLRRIVAGHFTTRKVRHLTVDG